MPTSSMTYSILEKGFQEVRVRTVHMYSARVWVSVRVRVSLSVKVRIRVRVTVRLGSGLV